MRLHNCTPKEGFAMEERHNLYILMFIICSSPVLNTWCNFVLYECSGACVKHVYIRIPLQKYGRFETSASNHADGLQTVIANKKF